MTKVMKEFAIRHEEFGDIGLEIEVEGHNLPVLSKWWRNEQDGSLKGIETREYVLDGPQSLEGIKTALDHLDKAYQANQTVVDDSVRAGVHVHINCQHLTMTQLYNFITLYLLLENLLVRWCGEYREGNLFCLRASDAEWMLYTIRKAANDGRKQFRNRFHNDELRYASLNLKALGDYGSLEFRAMRGTRDLGLIYKWAETLFNLREAACKFNMPTSIIEQFSVDGVDAFLTRTLGGNKDMFIRGCPDAAQLVWEGMRNAQDVAYCADWHKFEPKMRVIGGVEFPDDIPPNEVNEPPEDV